MKLHRFEYKYILRMIFRHIRMSERGLWQEHRCRARIYHAEDICESKYL